MVVSIHWPTLELPPINLFNVWKKMEQDTVTISKQAYGELIDRDAKLSALESFGVDNWEWYDDAMLAYYEGKD